MMTYSSYENILNVTLLLFSFFQKIHQTEFEDEVFDMGSVLTTS